MSEPAEYLCFETASPEETGRLGEALGKTLEPGDFLALVGGLGAGKTCLSQGVLSGLGVRGPVSSPTFTIVNEYQGRMPVYHLDVYRLENPEELEDIGYEELFYGDGVTVLEWADKVEGLLPREHLRIELATPGREDAAPAAAGSASIDRAGAAPMRENSRRIRIVPHGERGHRILRALAGHLAGTPAENPAGTPAERRIVMPGPAPCPPDSRSGGGA